MLPKFQSQKLNLEFMYGSEVNLKPSQVIITVSSEWTRFPGKKVESRK